MGADLYIKNLPRDLQYTGFRTDPDIGYFRDSYNRSNLLWQFDLSYWNDMKQWVNEEGEMTVQKAIEFLEELKKREPIFEKNMQKLADRVNRIWDYHTDYKTNETTYQPEDFSQKDKEGKETKSDARARLEWIKHYQDDYKVLKRFLKKAIELKSGIICSL